MDEDLHNIDDLFRNAINEHEEAPSGNVWEQIDKNLDKNKVVFISKKYNKLKWVAAAMFIFSVGVAMYTLNMKARIKDVMKQNNTYSKKAADQFKTGKKEIELNKLSDNKSPAEVKNKQTAGDSSSTGATENKHLSQKEASQNNLREAQPVIPGSAVVNPLKNRINQPQLSGIVKDVKPARGEQAVESKGNPDKVKSAVKSNRPLATNHDDILPDRSGEPNDLKGKDVSVAGNEQRYESHIPLAYAYSPRPSNIAGLNSKLAIKEKSANEAKMGRINAINKSLFSATVFYSFDFVSSKIDNDHHKFREDDRAEIKNKETIGKASSMGVLVGYRAGNNFSVESGLTFSTLTTMIQPKIIYARPDNMGNVSFRFNCSAGYSFIDLKSGARPAPGDSIPALSSENTLQYIGVPLAFRYYINKGKFSLSPGAGIAANFLAKGRIETVIAGMNGNEKAITDHIDGLNSMYLNGSISLGLNYTINRSLALSFMPAAKFALTSINKDAPVKTFLNSFGLAGGLTIRF